MAHSFIPQSSKDIAACAEIKPAERAILVKAFDLFQASHTRGGKPEMVDPFAIDPGMPLKIKIHRDFAGSFDSKKFGAATGISIEMGNGSRGGRGINNAGSLFEKRLTEDFNLYSKTRNPDNPKYFYKKFLQEFHELYGAKGARDIVVIPEGALNKKRPLVFTGSASEPVYIGQPFSQAGNVGKLVTDITVQLDNRPIYLSCKLGGTVTFFNIGITKYISREEIMAGEIKDKNGLIILDMFGISPVFFASVFKSAVSGDRNLPMPKQLIQDMTGKIDRIKLEHFLLSGIGYGYHLVHAKSATSDHIDDMVMSKENIGKFLKIERMVIRYPALGGAKRINVDITTSKFLFKINFRNTSGGISPDKLSCDYAIIHR